MRAEQMEQRSATHLQRPISTRVSVIIPCYNYGRFLEEALESVLAQTHPPDEIIIIDDGSTDTTPEVARRYADLPAVRVMRQQNQGAIATYNNGVRASTGDCFLILSADDRLDPRFLERTLPLLEAHPRLGYVYTAYRMFGVKHRVLPAPPFNPRVLARRPYIIATSLMRRAAFESCGGYSHDMDGGHEDWDFYVTLLEHGWYGAAMPEVLFHYRQHSAASRNAISARQGVAAWALVYRRHRRLYRLPPRATLWLADVELQVLRLKSVPKAAFRRLSAARRHRQRTQVCLVTTASTSAQRPFQHAGALATRYPVTLVIAEAGTVTAAPPHDQDHTVLRIPMGSSNHKRQPQSRGSLATLPAQVGSAVRGHVRLAAAAIRQRAAIYHAYGLAALPAAALAATANGSVLLYDAQEPQSLNRLPSSWWQKLCERLLLVRVDEVLAATTSTAELLSRKYGIAVTVVESEPLAPARDVRAGQQRIEETRLVQLYQDLISPNLQHP